MRKLLCILLLIMPLGVRGQSLYYQVKNITTNSGVFYTYREDHLPSLVGGYYQDNGLWISHAGISGNTTTAMGVDSAGAPHTMYCFGGSDFNHLLPATPASQAYPSSPASNYVLYVVSCNGFPPTNCLYPVHLAPGLAVQSTGLLMHHGVWSGYWANIPPYGTFDNTVSDPSCDSTGWQWIQSWTGNIQDNGGLIRNGGSVGGDAGTGNPGVPLNTPDNPAPLTPGGTLGPTPSNTNTIPPGILSPGGPQSGPTNGPISFPTNTVGTNALDNQTGISGFNGLGTAIQKMDGDVVKAIDAFHADNNTNLGLIAGLLSSNRNGDYTNVLNAISSNTLGPMTNAGFLNLYDAADGVGSNVALVSNLYSTNYLGGLGSNSASGGRASLSTASNLLATIDTNVTSSPDSLAFTIHTGTISHTFDLDPAHSSSFAPIAAWFRTAFGWLVDLGYLAFIVNVILHHKTPLGINT